MLREEFLMTATRQNLYSCRLIRDAVICLQTGIRAGEVATFIELEREKVRLENALGQFIKNSKGFVGDSLDNGFITHSTLLCEENTIKQGVLINTSLTVDEREIMRARENPPVGMRGTLFIKQRELSKEVYSILDEVNITVSKIINLQSAGKTLSGFSLTALECLRLLITDYAAVASELSKGESAILFTRPDIMRKLLSELKSSLDRSEIKIFDWLENASSEESVFARFAASSAGGVLKSTFPPLMFDLCYRYALSVKVIDI